MQLEACLYSGHHFRDLSCRFDPQVEIDLSSLGIFTTAVAAVFSKLGVPIKTTVAPMVCFCHMPTAHTHARAPPLQVVPQLVQCCRQPSMGPSCKGADQHTRPTGASTVGRR